MNDSSHPTAIPSSPTAAELAAAMRQYLRSLKDAGMESVPRGRGRFFFEFGQEIAAVEKAASANPASLARERPVAYTAELRPTATTEVWPSASLADPSPIASEEPQAEFPFAPRPNSLVGTGDSYETQVDLRSYPPSLVLAQRQTELQLLSESVSSCKKCSELARCRNKVVFGTGNLTPRLVFLGEAPGADEDKQGEPFVGAAGQLLNKIIGACKLDRSDVYILNTVKCRPPGNRNPAADELENCWAFTQRQLEVLRPEFICCLGLIATKQLLKTTQPLGRLRQRFHQYRESKVLVTYHPAYLLRTESAKKHVWEDMKILMKEMGIALE